MRVCVVGAGAREHAIAEGLAVDADEVVVTPGNAGIPWSTDAAVEDVDADLYVIGPEGPLADGLADRLRADGKVVLGPSREASALESSKQWAKDAMAELGIPTARAVAFDDADAALAHLERSGGPYVVKADGLAEGKGVLVTSSRMEARADIVAKLSGAAFGEAGRVVVIEEALTGRELSVFGVTDGKDVVALPCARDYKPVFDGNAGPNTGGMGAFSPVPGFSRDDVDDLIDRFATPMVGLLRDRGLLYRGFVYVGLIETEDGMKVIEYNVRFGEPEAQVVLPRVRSGLAPLLHSAAVGSLDRAAHALSEDAAVTVMMATEGYPGPSRLGDVIDGVAAAAALDGVRLYWKGVKLGDGSLVTSGGRVLSVTGIGPTLAEARATAYRGVGAMSWPGEHHRSDVAADPGVADGSLPVW